ncbi:hypothetical protein MBLNU230_g4800t1 [Neophaeotheca triangularis]
MPAQTQGVYVTENFSEPMSAQHNFANQFDLNKPEAAMGEYQKIMHQHTKRQFEVATASSRRRSSGEDSRMTGLPSESSRGSVSSSGS